MTGAARVAKATPDGYTMLLSGSAVLAIIPTLYKKPLYNAVTDFEHVALVLGFGARAAHAQGLSGEQPRRVRRLRQGQPGQAAVRLRRRRLGHAHVRRCCSTRRWAPRSRTCPIAAPAPAMQDLIGGRLDFVAEQISTALPQIQGNALKAIATLGLDRAPGLDDLPTARGARRLTVSTAVPGARSRFRRERRTRSCAVSPAPRTRRSRRRWCASGSKASA